MYPKDSLEQPTKKQSLIFDKTSFIHTVHNADQEILNKILRQSKQQQQELLQE